MLSALAGILVLLVLWVSGIAAGWTHTDGHDLSASQPGHLCVVCLFAHSQVLGPEAPLDLVPGIFSDWMTAVYPCLSTHAASTLALLPLGRAPPLLFS